MAQRSIFSKYQKRIQQLNNIQIKQRLKASIGLRFTCDINLDSIIQQLTKVNDMALSIISQELPDALNAAMRSDVWGRSRDGDSDIIDTGELSRSLNISMTNNGLTISYDSPYAGIIHYGGYIVPYGNDSLEKVYISPKPWLESVAFGNGPIPGYDFRDAYLRAIDIIL